MENQSLQLNKRVPKILAILGISLGLGLLFNYFFYGQDLGLSFPLYIWIILGVIFGLLSAWKIKFNKNTYWLILPLLFFPAMIAIHNSILLSTLNVLTTFFVITLFLKVLMGEKIKNYLIPNYVTTAFSVPLTIIHQGGNAILDFVGLKSLIKGHKHFSQIMKGIIMAIPALIIFVALFSSADLVFQKYFLSMFEININQELMPRIVIVLLASFIISGILRYATHHAEQQTSSEEIIPITSKKIGVIEISIFLGLINALFLVFILIQLTYLFGGANNISVQGFTYAEYAHKGFFELIVVAVISFLIVIYSEKSVEQKNDNHTTSFKALSLALTLQVIVIMASAFQRLSLYENAFGFTELRLYTQLFIIWLGLIFLLLIYKILVDKRENIFAFNSFVCSLIFLCFLNLFNPDKFIAQKNIGNFPVTGKLDIGYLNTLSDDAVPEILKGLNSNDLTLQQLIATGLYQKTYDKTYDNENWQSWNLARSEAKNALQPQWQEIKTLHMNSPISVTGYGEE